MREKDDVRFCVCAMVDLLGFSSHLENSAYDLRTTIGQQAIKRLETLEDAVALFSNEARRAPEYYDNRIVLQRINDALFMSMDLDEILVPPIGQTTFHDIPITEINDRFTEDQLKSPETFVAAHSERLRTALDPLRKFVGVVARIHLFVSKHEAKGYFPGARTVLSSGFRRPFLSRRDQRDDNFSANFAFANVVAADKHLHGIGMFVDNNIVEMLAKEVYSKNVLQFAHMSFSCEPFDCFESAKNVFEYFSDAEIPNPIEVELFRKRYIFRRLQAAPLSYLQNLPSLWVYLCGEIKPNLENLYYRNIVQAMQQGVGHDNGRPLLRPCLMFNGSDGMDTPVEQFREFIEKGRSATKEKIKDAQLVKDHGVDGKIPKEIADLLDHEIEVDLHPIEIEGLGLALFFMSEDTFSSLLPILTGDFTLLEYRAGPKGSDDG
jgi:hypothetical protein